MPFLEHNGKLAFTAGWFVNSDRPVETRTLYVSKANAADWPLLIENKQVRIDWTGNVGLIYFLDRRPVTMDTTDWEVVTQEQPVKKPRRGRRQGQAYDWEWKYGKWIRKWLD